MTKISDRVTYALAENVATIVMDDGKVNAMSPAMLTDLHTAFDRAEADKAVVLLTGQGKCFSAGFDLKVFASGDAAAALDMLTLGATLAERLMSFPTPVVAACNANAYPMGAFLLMSSDLRLGADGAYKVGMNEVTIGLTLPQFAIEIARARLTPPYFNRALMTGEMFEPHEAVTAGFLDLIVPADELMQKAQEAATRLTAVDMTAHAQSKLKARGPALAALRHAIETELTPENYGAARQATA